MNDLKTIDDRIGDRYIFPVTNRQRKFFIFYLFLMLSATMTASVELQEYIKSHNKTVAEVRLPFTKLSNVPQWQINFHD